MVNGYWSTWIGRCLSVGLSAHPVELGGPGPFCLPLAASSLDPELSDIFHFFFHDCSAFSAVIIMPAAVFYMIMFCLVYLHCRDDISFRQFIFAFYIFTFDT